MLSSHRTILLLTTEHWSLILLIIYWELWPIMLFDLMNNLARFTGALMWQMHFWRRAGKAQSREREERDESKQALLSPLLCTLSHANRQEINPLWLIRTASGVSSAHLCPVASDTHKLLTLLLSLRIRTFVCNLKWNNICTHIYLSITYLY